MSQAIQIRAAAVEQEAVLVHIPHYGRVGNSPQWFTVDLDGDDVSHVHFPDHWRNTMENLGYPESDWLEGYLIGLAHKAFKFSRL
jgi:hypothetical protein